ncbi:hypothetical protein [Fodinicurvata sp. EGI_FJ10296]|jgi:hypothetical protein|uniref:hypothetical protein n=1 Tax=Fodinicurvata sp. EGI_FJ10296 TaxID=3231908 RepID=UPI003454E6F4
MSSFSDTPFQRASARSMAWVPALAVLLFPQPGAADTLGFQLQNNAGEAIVTVHVSPDWKRDWGVDHLDDGPIDPGGSRFIAVVQEDRYCYFDVMVRTESSATHTYWFINACEHQTVTHTD